MKSLAISISLLFSCSNIFVCRAQQVISDEQAIRGLRQFYVNYITYAYELKQGRKKLDSLLKRFSTARLTTQLKGQEEENYDFFLNTNGCDTEWLKTLKVAKDGATKDVYEVSWVFPADPVENKDNKRTRIKLQLIKTSKSFLIDRIIR